MKAKRENVQHSVVLLRMERIVRGIPKRWALLLAATGSLMWVWTWERGNMRKQCVPSIKAGQILHVPASFWGFEDLLHQWWLRPSPTSLCQANLQISTGKSPEPLRSWGHLLAAGLVENARLDFYTIYIYIYIYIILCMYIYILSCYIVYHIIISNIRSYIVLNISYIVLYIIIYIILYIILYINLYISLYIIYCMLCYILYVILYIMYYVIIYYYYILITYYMVYNI